MPVILSRRPGGDTVPGPPNGPAGGDLTGTYPNPDVAIVDNAVLGSGTPDATTFLRGDRSWSKLEFDYVQITSNASVTSTLATAPDTIITANPVTYDGATTIFIELFAALAGTPAANGSFFRFGIWEGATDLGRVAALTNGTGIPSMSAPVNGRLRLTPSAGAHTYKAVAWVSSGTGTLGAGIGGASGVTVPAFLRQVRAN